jgi:hypothetical protein
MRKLDRNDIANEILQLLIPKMEEIKDRIRDDYNPRIAELRTTVQKFIDDKSYTTMELLQVQGVIEDRTDNLISERDIELEVAGYIMNELFDMRLQASKKELFNGNV